MANSYSDIFSAYKSALNRSHNAWKDSVSKRGKNAEVFYNNFFKDLIVNNGEKINQSNFRSEVIQHIKKFFGKDELNFVAVDGSNDKHQSAEAEGRRAGEADDPDAAQRGQESDLRQAAHGCKGQMHYRSTNRHGKVL